MTYSLDICIANGILWIFHMHYKFACNTKVSRHDLCTEYDTCRYKANCWFFLSTMIILIIFFCFLLALSMFCFILPIVLLLSA